MEIVKIHLIAEGIEYRSSYLIKSCLFYFKTNENQLLQVFFFYLLLLRLYISVEPIASAKPKFTMTEKLRAYSVNANEPLTLFCPAQAFPVPAFR